VESEISLSTVHFAEQWRNAAEEKEGEEQATLHGFLPSDGGAAVVDNDSRRFLWRRRKR